MELTYDWKSFQSIFYSKKRLFQTSDTSRGPLYVITQGTIIISIFSDGEDMSDWVGATCDELKAAMPQRDCILFTQEQVDQWMSSSVDETHYYDQIQFLRNQARPQLTIKGKNKKLPEILGQKHFLLTAIQGWWSKILPTHYGIYIRLDGNPKSSLFLTVQRGRVASFEIPDLSGMVKERSRLPGDISKFLNEKYLMPVYGIFLTSQEWNEWSESANPWKSIVSSIKSDHSKITPFKWTLVVLIAFQAYVGR